jgi:hypothetical protein
LHYQRVDRQIVLHDIGACPVRERIDLEAGREAQSIELSALQVLAENPLRPEIVASKPASALASGTTLGISQQPSGSCFARQSCRRLA